ncbi:MAG: hypothetical protein K6B67_04085 [Lachnospiraceae bacterium]|nr:hypothetical protein [Lachnospiraceae bacterium]
MGKKYKSLLLVFSLILVFVFTACSSDKAVTLEKFEKRAHSYGYAVWHCEDDYTEDPTVTDFAVAHNEDKSIQIQRFELESESAAQSFYSTNVRQFRTYGSGSENSNMDMNLVYYQMAADGFVYEACQKGNTCILIMGKSKYRDNAEKFLKNIGYLPK